MVTDPWQVLAEAGADSHRPLRALGLSCGRLPLELPLALGLQPWRVRPTGEPPVRASTFMQGFACSFLQQLLHQGLGGELAFLCGLTLVGNGCDSMRALPALWRASGATPARLFSLRVPLRLDAASARDLVEAELGRWIAWLEALAGQRLQLERLRETVRTENRLRRALRRLRELASEGVLATSRLHTALHACDVLPSEQVATLVEAALESTDRAAPRIGPRLALCGGLLQAGPLLDFVEAHGALIVDDDTCALGHLLEEACDIDPERPLDDLADRLLRRPPCPVSAGSGERRLRRLVERVQRLEVQGVLLLRHRGCECHGFDNVLLARGLATLGLAHLVLELEPGEAVSGQTATRLEAFLEMLSGAELP